MARHRRDASSASGYYGAWIAVDTEATMHDGAQVAAAKAHPHSMRRGVVVCALLSLATALVAFGPFILADGGAFHVREDFDFQQIPFTMALQNQILRGGLDGWCWNLDLGASAIQGFGFYELGSPFFWASLPFGANAFPYVVGWMYVAKYVVAAVTCYLWARRLVRGELAATACALLYAFSGFQTANLLFYHFHDVVALFPLMLLGLDRLMAHDDDGLPFCLAVAVNALANYFFFVQSTIFLLLYFSIRYAPALWRSGNHALVRTVGRCLVRGILGAGLAGMLLVPSFLYMLQSPRAGSFSVSLTSLIFEPWVLAIEFAGALLPADAMHDHNALVAQIWNSTSCWLPVVGPALAISYVRKRRDWLRRLILVLLLVCVSPLLTSAFLLFTAVYQRWWYTLVLMGSLASARVVDDAADLDVRGGVRAYVCLVIGYVAMVFALGVLAPIPVLFHPRRLVAYALVSLCGALLTHMLLRNGTLSRRAGIALVGGICAIGALTSAMTLHFYRLEPYRGEMLEHIGQEERIDTLARIRLGTMLDTQDVQYRYDTGDNRLTLTGAAAGTSSFSSTVCAATGRFEEFFGADGGAVWHLNKRSVPGLTALLGGRYRVVPSAGATNAEVGHKVVARHVIDGVPYDVVEQPACPIGVVFDHYMLTEDAQAIDERQRALALLQAPVVSPEEEHAVAGFAMRVLAQDLDLSARVDDLCRSATARAVGSFARDDHGFSFATEQDGDALVYLSVPHDDGWQATIDGRPAQIVDSAGMMLLPVPAGSHTIEFSYQTPGIVAGMACSAASALALLAHWVRGVHAARRQALPLAPRSSPV